MKKSQPKRDFRYRLFESEPKEPGPEHTVRQAELQPAMRQIGITHCPICKTKVAVFLTKTNRPFVNCSFCSARVFYNGRESMRLLKKKMKPIED